MVFLLFITLLMIFYRLGTEQKQQQQQQPPPTIITNNNTRMNYIPWASTETMPMTFLDDHDGNFDATSPESPLAGDGADCE
jgi:hypothetical protein